MDFRAYLTLTDLKLLQNSFDEEESQTPYDPTAEDHNMRRFIRDACRLFDAEVNEGATRRRRFSPVYEVKYFDHPHVAYPGSLDAVTWATQLKLRDDLLEVETFTTKNGSVTLTTSSASFEYDTDPVRAHAITGWWGYHTDWANAWVDSGDTVLNTGGINTSATSIEVADPAGLNALGDEYRLQEMQLIKVDNELMYIKSIAATASPETLTVERGVNGSTAATHSEGATIYTFRPEEDVRTAIWAWALHLLRRKASVGSSGDVTTFAHGNVFVAHTMPGEVKERAYNYQTARL
jgi:hypothetical protein